MKDLWMKWYPLSSASGLWQNVEWQSVFQIADGLVGNQDIGSGELGGGVYFDPIDISMFHHRPHLAWKLCSISSSLHSM